MLEVRSSRRKGIPTRKVAIGSSRPLTEEEWRAQGIVKLAPEAASTNSIFKIRDSHHMVAKLIALGLPNDVIAAKTGYSRDRVRILRDVPAMQELVAQYRSVPEAEFHEEIATFYSLATANMLIAERMLNDRLVDAMDDGTNLPVKELLAISSDRADRFGFPKTGVNVNLNADFAAQLDKAIARSQAARREERETKVIEHVPSPAFAMPAEPPRQEYIGFRGGGERAENTIRVAVPLDRRF